MIEFSFDRDGEPASEIYTFLLRQ